MPINGKKTYTVALTLAAFVIAHRLGLIDDGTMKDVTALFIAAGMATLRHAITSS